MKGFIEGVGKLSLLEMVVLGVKVVVGGGFCVKVYEFLDGGVGGGRREVAQLYLTH